MNFKTKVISPLELSLDNENPRFIVSNINSEAEIINYMLENEEIIDLANGINANKGLLVGERIIVFKDGNKDIVAEGNRRTCACKILLNPAILPQKFKDKLEYVEEETKENLKTIQVDVVKTRLDAQSAIGTKHISGIKKWKPYSKIKFFATQFDNGKTTDFIANITSVNKSRVISDIKGYKLLKYAYKINLWSDEERKVIFDFNKINISIFTKALTLKSDILGEHMSVLLKLKYHPRTFEPISELPKELFDKCIYLIAKNSFDNGSDFNTRAKIDSIHEVIKLLDEYYKGDSEQIHRKPNDTDIEIGEPISLIEPNILGGISTANITNPENGGDNIQEPIDNPKNEEESTQEPIDNPKNEEESTQEPIDNPKNGEESTQEPIDNSKNGEDNTQEPIDNPEGSKNNIEDDETTEQRKEGKGIKIKTPNFFEALECTTVNNSLEENRGLINLVNEIKSISKNNMYKKFPIASTILMRSLLEQTMIYFLKKKNLYEGVKKNCNGKTPALEQLIKEFNKPHNQDKIFEKDATFRRNFTSFADFSGNKDYLDMVIHNPQLVVANAERLDIIADFGLRSFINTILNS